MNWFELAQALGSIATAIGVFVAAWQLNLQKKQATTQFEDELSKEYRMLAQKIPIRALLGQPLESRELETTLDEFYHYVDLTNEQIFLRVQGRVTKETWENWKEGIKANLSRPAFKDALKIISTQVPDSFVELRRLVSEEFAVDPREWS